MSRVLELDMDLVGVTPRVWRRVRVPGDLTLADLHRVIQVLMQWDDVHPHVFDVAAQEYGPEPEEEEIFLNWAGDDRKITVAAAAVKGDGAFEYSYDFGSERRLAIKVATGIPSAKPVIECVGGDGASFELKEANARLTEEFRADRPTAGATVTPEEQLAAALTLLLLFLSSWEEGKGTRVANKTLRLETLDVLSDAGLVVTNPHRKSVVLTGKGQKRALELLQRVTPLLSSNVK